MRQRHRSSREAALHDDIRRALGRGSESESEDESSTFPPAVLPQEATRGECVSMPQKMPPEAASQTPPRPIADSCEAPQPPPQTNADSCEDLAGVVRREFAQELSALESALSVQAVALSDANARANRLQCENMQLAANIQELTARLEEEQSRSCVRERAREAAWLREREAYEWGLSRAAAASSSRCCKDLLRSWNLTTQRSRALSQCVHLQHLLQCSEYTAARLVKSLAQTMSMVSSALAECKTEWLEDEVRLQREEKEHLEHMRVVTSTSVQSSYMLSLVADGADKAMKHSRKAEKDAELLFSSLCHLQARAFAAHAALSRLPGSRRELHSGNHGMAVQSAPRDSDSKSSIDMTLASSHRASKALEELILYLNDPAHLMIPSAHGNKMTQVHLQHGVTDTRQEPLRADNKALDAEGKSGRDGEADDATRGGALSLSHVLAELLVNGEENTGMSATQLVEDAIALAMAKGAEGVALSATKLVAEALALRGGKDAQSSILLPASHTTPSPLPSAQQSPHRWVSLLASPSPSDCSGVERTQDESKTRMENAPAHTFSSFMEMTPSLHTLPASEPSMAISTTWSSDSDNMSEVSRRLPSLSPSLSPPLSSSCGPRTNCHQIPSPGFKSGAPKSSVIRSFYYIVFAAVGYITVSSVKFVCSDIVP